MKIEKIVKTFAIAAVMVGSVFCFSQTTEAATVSIEKAAQKIYKAETKAYNTKKDVSVTVKIASPLRTKKAISKVTGELENALIKEELGDVDLTYVVRNTYVRPAIGEFIDHIGISISSKKAYNDFYRFYYPACNGARQTASYKNGVLTIKIDIQGSKKWYRDQYNENTYLAKCVEDLREWTDGLSEKDKAWTVAQWVRDCDSENGHPHGHFGYSANRTDGKYTKYSMIWKGNEAYGACEQNSIAKQLFGCLMGLNVGFVDDPAGEHAFNCVKIDGEIYYFDSTESATLDWDAFVKGQSNASKISIIDNFKEWVDGTSIGEWCLLTQDEYFNGYTGDDWDLSQMKIYWKLGNRFERKTPDWSKVQQL